MDAGRRTALSRLIILLDALLIVVAMGVSFAAHRGLRELVPVLKEAHPRLHEYVVLGVLTLPLWLGLIRAFELHRVDRSWRRGELLVALVEVHVLGLVGVSVLLFVTQVVINRTIVILFVAMTMTLLYVGRILVGWRLKWSYARGHGRARILLVGAPSRMRGFVERSLADPWAPVILGYLRDGDPASHSMPPPAPMPVELRGALERLPDFLHDNAVDEVLFFPPHNDPVAVERALDACQRLGVPASFALDLQASGGTRPRIVVMHDQPFATFELAHKPPLALAIKHTLDFFVALALLALAAPVLLLASLAILVTSGRPIFFVQERAGRSGRPFKMLKLRTMVSDAGARRAEVAALNELSGPVFKAAADPRITPLGKVLRKTSIDELPQLFNVLTGSMSLVGPRPLHVEEQQNVRGWHRRRLSMKPGITGLWQVSGRSDVDFDEWMRLDLVYVDTWSPSLDVKILLRTVPAVLSGKGAR